MCGITLLVFPPGYKGALQKRLVEEAIIAIQNRGPDAVEVQTWTLDSGHTVIIVASVLSMQRIESARPVARQPVEFTSRVGGMAWNGEAWELGRCDTEAVTESVEKRICSEPSSTAQNVHTAVCAALDDIVGPWATCVVDCSTSSVVFGRDAIGRRSLLLRLPDSRKTEPEPFIVSSVVIPSISGLPWSKRSACSRASTPPQPSPDPQRSRAIPMNASAARGDGLHSATSRGDATSLEEQEPLMTDLREVCLDTSIAGGRWQEVPAGWVMRCCFSTDRAQDHSIAVGMKSPLAGQPQPCMHHLSDEDYAVRGGGQLEHMTDRDRDRDRVLNLGLDNTMDKTREQEEKQTTLDVPMFPSPSPSPSLSLPRCVAAGSLGTHPVSTVSTPASWCSAGRSPLRSVHHPLDYSHLSPRSGSGSGSGSRVDLSVGRSDGSVYASISGDRARESMLHGGEDELLLQPKAAIPVPESQPGIADPLKLLPGTSRGGRPASDCNFLLGFDVVDLRRGLPLWRPMHSASDTPIDIVLDKRGNKGGGGGDFKRDEPASKSQSGKPKAQCQLPSHPKGCVQEPNDGSKMAQGSRKSSNVILGFVGSSPSARQVPPDSVSSGDPTLGPHPDGDPGIPPLKDDLPAPITKRRHAAVAVDSKPLSKAACSMLAALRIAVQRRASHCPLPYETIPVDGSEFTPRGALETSFTPPLAASIASGPDEFSKRLPSCLDQPSEQPCDTGIAAPTQHLDVELLAVRGAAEGKIIAKESSISTSAAQQLTATPRSPMASAGKAPLELEGNEVPARLAVLFSGGLDCTVIARLAHECVPPDEPIDLLSACFDHPKYCSPDRQTALSSWANLRRTCPDRRWRLVLVNVSPSEVHASMKHISALLWPRCTNMDLSLGMAIWNAAGGQGQIASEGDCPGNNECEGESFPRPRPKPRLQFRSTARVLLSGLGADELCGGYGRHATAISRGGWHALTEELSLDVDRMWARNLGRDDRIVSDRGKELRTAFLDEGVLECLAGIPVDAILDPTLPKGQGDKRIIRAIAENLGLGSSSFLPKRAVQFGSRVAKVLNVALFGSSRQAKGASSIMGALRNAQKLEGVGCKLVPSGDQYIQIK